MGNKRTVIGLNGAAIMMMLGVGMIMALLPQRIMSLTGSRATVGYLASAFAFSYIVLQVPIGNLSDRIGFKLFLIFGYLICSLAGILYFFANHPNLYFMGRVLQGIGEAPIWALAPALLSIKYPTSKGKVMGLYNASIHVGLTIGPILGIMLVSRLTGNLPFLFYAGVCFIGALIVTFSVEKVRVNDVAEKPAISFGNIIELVTSNNSLIALTGIMLYGAGYGFFLTTIPAFLIGVKNFNQTSVSLFFVLFYIAISLSQILTGIFSDRMGRKIFMIIGLLTASIGIAVFPGLNQPFIIVALGVGSLGLGIFYLASIAFLNEVVPNSLKGTISGAYYLFWGIGFFFGPILMGKIDTLGYSRLGYLAFAAFLLLEVLVLFFGINKTPGRKLYS